jgi:hypothetical protein
MQPAIRVLVLGLPRLIGDLVVRMVEAEPDMCVVGEPHARQELATAAHVHTPELVIVGLEEERLPAECEAFLRDRARVKLLGIEAFDGRAVLYELRPERRSLGSVTQDEIVGAIRAAAGREAAG